MSRFLPILFVALLAFEPIHAQNPPSQSAISALRAFGKERSDTLLSRVVGVVGFNGQNQPSQWLVLQADVETPNMLHEYVVLGGKVVAQRRFMRDPNQDLPTIPIVLSRLAIDSPRAFALAEQAARKAGVGFDSMNYQLRCRDLRNEPVWVLSLMDSVRRNVGVVYLSALTGENLRSVWHRPGPMTTSAPTAPPAPQQDVRRGLIPQLVDRISDRRDGTSDLSDSNIYAVPGMPNQAANR